MEIEKGPQLHPTPPCCCQPYIPVVQGYGMEGHHVLLSFSFHLLCSHCHQDLLLHFNDKVCEALTLDPSTLPFFQ